jgi:hypothetical protein
VDPFVLIGTVRDKAVEWVTQITNHYPSIKRLR